MSAYVNKVRHLTARCEAEALAAQEWQMVAENRGAMLESVMSELQVLATAVAPMLVKMGIEPSTPINIDVLNTQLASGDDIYVTSRMILSTISSDIVLALQDSVQVIESISDGSLTISEISQTARPRHDLTWTQVSDTPSDDNRSNAVLTPTQEPRRFDESDDESVSSGSDDEAPERSSQGEASLTIAVRHPAKRSSPLDSL